MPKGAGNAGDSYPQRRLILSVACLGAFMAALDTSIVNIALPQIAREFHSSLVQISWVMVVYLLLNVSLLLTSGRLGDLLAPGRLFILGMLIFTGASALCGLSRGLAFLVAGRAFQGVGASLMLGVAPKLIALAYREGERGLALGLFSMAFATGISVGAPLGGIITTYLGWPYIFFLNLPICGMVLILGGRALGRLPASSAWDRRAFDLWGGLTLAGTLGFFLLSLTRMRASGWRDAWTLGTLGLAAGLGVLLFFLERRQAAPLFPADLWRDRAFILGSLAVVLTFGAVMGAFFLLPFFLEQTYGYSPKQTGFLLAAVSVTNALVAPWGGYLADRLGNLLVLRTGTGLMFLGLGSLIFTWPESGTLSLAARFGLIGLGFGLFQAPNLNEILKGVKPAFIGLAASTNAVLKNLGALLGITLIVTVFAWINLHQVRLGAGVCLGITSFQSAFAVAVLVGAVNLLANLLPRKPG
ncbi:MAG: MFS transporter [Desulfobaccales bacterium]|nr:MFS transporter [Desulfobaccales bacterium]